MLRIAIWQEQLKPIISTSKNCIRSSFIKNPFLEPPLFQKLGIGEEIILIFLQINALKPEFGRGEEQKSFYKSTTSTQSIVTRPVSNFNPIHSTSARDLVLPLQVYWNCGKHCRNSEIVASIHIIFYEIFECRNGDSWVNKTYIETWKQNNNKHTYLHPDDEPFCTCF